MKRTILWVLFLFPLPLTASAQSLPVVEVIPAGGAKRPPLPVQSVAVVNCYAPLAGARREELATIRVVIPARWERSAEHLAKEKAAEIGANCLQGTAQDGEGGANAPSEAVYRAVRVEIPYGQWMVPASPGSFASAQAAGAGFRPASFRPLKDEKRTEHEDHLRLALGAAYAHEVLVAPASAGEGVWADILMDVKEFLKDPEYEKFPVAARDGKPVRIDFINGRVF